MEEELISFETAKLAKEKGFDWKCFGNYHIGRINGKNHVSAIQTYEQDFNNYREPHRCGYEGKKKDRGQLTTSAPTQSLLQRWLREKHIVFVRPEWFWCFKSGLGSGKYHVFVNRDYENISGAYKVTFDTYEKALEKGLFEALKLIKL